MSGREGPRAAATPRRTIAGPQLESMLQSLSQALEKELMPKREESGTEDKKMSVTKIKDYFSIGINEVTRALEKMPKKDCKKQGIQAAELSNSMQTKGKELLTPCATLQGAEGIDNVVKAVLVAADVEPKILVSHLGPLCGSRNVPVLFVSGGDGRGSLRLGELVRLRTAMAVGIKTGTSAINEIVQSIWNQGT